MFAQKTNESVINLMNFLVMTKESQMNVPQSPPLSNEGRRASSGGAQPEPEMKETEPDSRAVVGEKRAFGMGNIQTWIDNYGEGWWIPPAVLFLMVAIIAYAKLQEGPFQNSNQIGTL